MKILVTGAVRSGKTRYALKRAEALGQNRFYLATAQALDQEMAERIAAHQSERGAGWATIEEPLAIAPLLEQPGVVLLDCLTLWLSNVLMRDGEDVDLRPQLDAFVRAVQATKNPMVLITNEVGWGLVPETLLGRRFRDCSGYLSQELARVMDEVTLMVAGLPVSVK